MTLTIIASVALSLATTNEYRWTRPTTTNLTGRGMGAASTNLIVAAEDVAFLAEAWSERWAKLGGRGSLDAGGHVVAEEDWRINASDVVRSLYLPTWGRWDTGRYGNSAYLVQPTVTWPEDDYWETGNDYRVAGVSTDATNGVTAFMPFGSFAVATNAVATNVALRGWLSREPITNLYADVMIDAGVLDTSGMGLEPPYVASRLVTRTRTASGSVSYGDPVTYTYRPRAGETAEGTYYTSYAVTVTRSETATTNVADVTGADLYWRCWRNSYQPTSVQRNDYTSPHRFTLHVVGEPYDTGLQESSRLVAGGPMRLATTALRTNEVETATCMAVIRFESIRTQGYAGATSERGGAVTNWHVGTARGTVRRLEGESAKWETDIDVVDAVRDISEAEAWVTSVAAAEVEVGETQVDSNPGEIYAQSMREVRIVGLEVIPYSHFVPTFRARAEED